MPGSGLTPECQRHHQLIYKLSRKAPRRDHGPARTPPRQAAHERRARTKTHPRIDVPAPTAWTTRLRRDRVDIGRRFLDPAKNFGLGLEPRPSLLGPGLLRRSARSILYVFSYGNIILGALCCPARRFNRPFSRAAVQFRSPDDKKSSDLSQFSPLAIAGRFSSATFRGRLESCMAFSPAP